MSLYNVTVFSLSLSAPALSSFGLLVRMLFMIGFSFVVAFFHRITQGNKGETLQERVIILYEALFNNLD